MSSVSIPALLIEDHPGDARLIREMLKDVPSVAVDLTWAERLGAGLRLLEERVFEIVLVDLSLPDGEGLESFAAVYARVPQVPIIVLTGLDDQEVAMQAVRLGAQDYLVKGQVTGALLVRAMRYAIERKRAERALRESEERTRYLEELDRLKAQFIANSSHELRTPLNAIIGFSGLMLKGMDGPLNEMQRHDLETIHNSGKHLLSLINDLLDVSQLWAGKIELEVTPVDLRDVVRDALDMVSSMVEGKPVTLQHTIAANVPVVRADQTRVRQILINLLTNAVKYTEHGQVTLSLALVGDEVVTSVTDTGIGIAPDDLGLLFEEFSRVDNSTTRQVDGLGLGLSICRRLVELHGGRIWAESEEGVGSQFHFSLPVDGPGPDGDGEGVS
jgi:signal transduction histidine kinase